MKVYLVWPEDYPEDVNLYGVYADREKAEIAAKEFSKAEPYQRDFYVEEWDVAE